MLLAFILLSILPMQKVKAGGADKYVKNNFKEMVINDKNDYIFTLQEPLTPIKKVKITSSNTKVATVKNMGWDQVNQFRLTPKKEGTTKITITGTADGKKIKLKGTVKVVNFQNPFSMFKINGKSYLSEIKFRRNFIHSIQSNKSNIRLQYKLKSGWSLLSGRMTGVINGVRLEKEVKNGTTYPRPKGRGDHLIISMELKNKSTDAVIRLEISEMNYD